MQNRKLVRYAWLLLLPILQACSLFGPTPVPRTTGQLTSERSQVYHAPGGGSGQEVPTNATRTARNGDEIWTVKGRALLKFPDLWLRLYDDTTLRAEDVTPSSVKAAMGAGATLVGATPGVYDRIEITAGDPPHARITLAGTLVMIAHVPGKRVTLVRAFGGRVNVRSAVGDASRTAGPTEWVLVGNDNAVGLIDNEQMIRDLARELGMYDLFHDIEQDAGNFGPVGAAVVPSDVQIVFGAEPVPPCPQPKLEIGKPRAEGNSVLIEGAASPGCSQAPIQRVSWDWGDGHSDDQAFPAKHQYDRVGRYRVTVTVYDRLGRTATSQIVVSISGSTQPPALPNLTVTLRAPEQATCGEKLGDRIQVTVTNRGNADAGSFAVGIYLSRDQQITTSDMLLTGGREIIGKLAAGATVQVSMRGSNQIPVNLSEGVSDYWLGAIADDQGQVTETSKEDNTAVVPIHITCLK
jgi:hypothetical protein